MNSCDNSVPTLPFSLTPAQQQILRESGVAERLTAVSDVEALRRELDAKGIQPGDIEVQQHEGKHYRVFFSKEPYGVCFCFGQPHGE